MLPNVPWDPEWLYASWLKFPLLFMVQEFSLLLTATYSLMTLSVLDSFISNLSSIAQWRSGKIGAYLSSVFTRLVTRSHDGTDVKWANVSQNEMFLRETRSEMVWLYDPVSVRVSHPHPPRHLINLHFSTSIQYTHILITSLALEQYDWRYVTLDRL